MLDLLELSRIIFSVDSILFLGGNFTKLDFKTDITRINDKFVNIDPIEYSFLEIIGEIACAHWFLGNRRKAWGAMAGLVRKLAEIDNFENKRFRGLFFKTGHVLGWMAIAANGQPPSHNVITGEEYTEPSPGLFSASTFKSDDFGVPLSWHILFFQLGLFAYGCGLYELSGRNFSKAKQLNPPEQTKYYIDVTLAELSARKENYADALLLSTSGVKAQTLSTHIRKNLGALGIDSATVNISFEEVWQNLPNGERPDSTPWIYWNTIGPGLARLLKEGQSISKYREVISQFEEVFKERPELIDLDFWLNIFKELKIAFSPLATKETINEQLRAFPNDLNMQMLLFFALWLSDAALLERNCVAQASVLDFLMRTLPYTKLMVEYISIYLIKFWARAVKKYPSAFQSPQLFDSFLQSVHLPVASKAVLIILMAADEIGAYIDDDIFERLVNLAPKQNNN